MRLVFAGTPEFARVALEHLHKAGHEIALVLTQPDRPAGRGLKLQASSVKQYALEKGFALAQPRSLRLDGKYPDDALAARAAIEAARADAMVVAAYGLILPQWVLDLMAAAPGRAADEVAGAEAPKHGCFNIHASLLPRWRGAAPIHRAIEAGDSETGVTIMQMDAGLDTGDMLMAHSTPITPADTTGTLQDRLALLGARLMLMTLEKAAAHTLRPVPQLPQGVSYANKIEKHEASIDWAQPASAIARKVRAFNPFPGATATLNGEVLKVWMAMLAPAAPAPHAEPGTVLLAQDQGIAVAAKDSIVLITELQRPGARRMGMAELLRGFDLRPGTVFQRHRT
ncbi:MAG: methionyl-tRNA formyltransferase [Rhodoferax sp.]